MNFKQKLENKSEIALHSIKLGRTIDYNGTRILHKGFVFYKERLTEAIYDQKTFSFTSDPLTHTYNCYLNTLFSTHQISHMRKSKFLLSALLTWLDDLFSTQLTRESCTNLYSIILMFDYILLKKLKLDC